MRIKVVISTYLGKYYLTQFNRRLIMYKNRWRKVLILIVLVMMVASIITACSQEAELVEGYFPGNVAPDFTLLKLDDTEISLSEFQGKAVLLVFWASW